MTRYSPFAVAGERLRTRSRYPLRAPAAARRGRKRASQVQDSQLRYSYQRDRHRVAGEFRWGYGETDRGFQGRRSHCDRDRGWHGQGYGKGGGEDRLAEALVLETSFQNRYVSVDATLTTIPKLDAAAITATYAALAKQKLDRPSRPSRRPRTRLISSIGSATAAGSRGDLRGIAGSGFTNARPLHQSSPTSIFHQPPYTILAGRPIALVARVR